jgi:hypothetical protein
MLILAASFLGSVIYLSYEAELTADPTPAYVLFAFLIVAAAFGIRGYLKTRTIEFYDDHLRVLGYNQDGQDSMDAAYSAVEVKGRSKASVFLLSINVVPPMSLKVANKGVKASAGTVPLFAWIKEKKGSLTEQR